MHLVPEQDLTSSRRVHDLKGERKPDESFRGQAIHSMTRDAGDGAGRVVVARGAVPRGADTCRTVGGAGAVTAAAGKRLVPLVFKGAAPDASGRGAILQHDRRRRRMP